VLLTPLVLSSWCPARVRSREVMDDIFPSPITPGTPLRTQGWEAALLSTAHEAWSSVAAVVPRSGVSGRSLHHAYSFCNKLTARYSRSFHLASSFLPAGKRRAIRALYAFCRTADNIVDTPGTDSERDLAAWRRGILSPDPPAGDLLAIAWADAHHRYCIPHRLMEQLIDGVAQDLNRARYRTFDDLAAYAYGVASTVGLMSMQIIGFSGEEAIPFAVKLGVALQLTNILRDVGEDWQMGRVYLPADELEEFGLSDADLAAGRVDARWRALMRFQIERNRRLYAEAWPGISMLHRDGQFAVAAAAELYRGILDDIESHEFDVFHRRAHLHTWRRLRMLPGLWWRARRGLSL